MSENVVIFPGQGAQSVGMGKDVAQASTAAAAVYRRADDILGFELSRICFEGPEPELTRTDIQQPAIFVTSVAIWEALIERGATPEALLGACAGLSLGEYTALHVAGSLTFENALKTVRARGQLMHQAAEDHPGGMVSIIGADEPTVQELCTEAAQGDVLVLANYNCPGQIVISGALAACQRAVKLAGKHRARALLLKVAGGFHSPLMQHAAEKLGHVLGKTPFAAPRCPVIANVDAAPHQDAQAMRRALQRQVTEAVRWHQSIERLTNDGFGCFIEIGPGRVLTGMMRKINRQLNTVNVSTAAGLDIDELMSKTA